jgi:protease YdgD
MNRNEIVAHMMRMQTMLIKASLAALLLIAVITGGHAQDSAPKRPGIGPQDGRIRIDPNKGPWRAVGKIQIPAASWISSCTGTLVAPAIVLTAAHCVFNPRTGALYRPAAIHFLIGADGDDYAGHAKVVSFTTGTGYDHAHPQASLGSDWALLVLDTKLGTPDRILPIRATPPAVGAAIMIGGYSEDRRYILTADTTCHVTAAGRDQNGGHLLKHNCTGTRGVSGAPMLVEDQGHWSIGAVDVAAQLGVAVGFAATLEEAKKHL